MFTAAVIQMNCNRDAGRNLAQADELVRRAAALGADFVATPENTGYLGPQADKPRLAHYRKLHLFDVEINVEVGDGVKTVESDTVAPGDGPGVALAKIEVERVDEIRRAIPVSNHRKLS